MNNLMRKHGKWILAVLGAFLMLTFTLPSVLKNNSDPGSYEAGRLNGKKIVGRDVLSANAEITVLARLGLLGSSVSPGILTIGALPNGYYATVPLAYINEIGSNNHDTERGTHWLLLLQEAQKFGILPIESEITDVVQSMHAPEDKLLEDLHNMNFTNSDFRTAIGHALMIQKLAILTMRSTPVPVPLLEFVASENYAKVQVQYAILDGTPAWPKSPEPSPDQIQKQFDLYKDIIATLPGSATPPPTIDGHNYPFGYKYPDRVQAEFLKFDRSEVAQRFKPTREDYEEAFRYYTQHPDEFKNATDNSFAVSTQPAVKPFEEVRNDLVQRQVDDRVNKFLKRVTDRVSSITSAPWNNAKEAEGGFREPIPTSQWVDYKSVPDTIKGMHEFDGFTPHYGAITQFEDRTQLAQEPGIGEATYEHQNTPYTFPDLATHVHELGDFPDFPKLYLQIGIDGPIVKDSAGNLYIYRVTAADKTHAPASLDEVRAQVIEDLKKIAAYDRTQSDARQLADAASHADLLKLAQLKGYIARTTPELNHLQREIPDLGPVPGFIDAAFNLASQNASSQPATQAAQGAPSTVLNDDAALKVYVLSLGRFVPVSPADFATQRPMLINTIQELRGIDFANGWLNLDSIAKRLNYVPARPFDTKQNS